MVCSECVLNAQLLGKTFAKNVGKVQEPPCIIPFYLPYAEKARMECVW
jgi:hypothetical protein